MIVAEYQEKETGTERRDRPILKAAIDFASITHATLAVSEIDRLTRDMLQLVLLQRSKIPYICCDNPHATVFIHQIQVAVAQDEVARTRMRTKRSLSTVKCGQSAKAYGTSENAMPKASREKVFKKARKKGGTVSGTRRRESAQKHYSSVRRIAQPLRDQGWTYKQIAEKLNDMHVKTTTGGVWHTGQISRVLQTHDQE